MDNDKLEAIAQEVIDILKTKGLTRKEYSEVSRIIERYGEQHKKASALLKDMQNIIID